MEKDKELTTAIKSIPDLVKSLKSYFSGSPPNPSQDPNDKIIKDADKKIEVPIQDGSSVYVADPDGDGSVQIGDMVTDKTGNPLPSSKITCMDGTILETDENSAVKTITPGQAPQNPAASKPSKMEEIESAIKSITIKYSELKEEYETKLKSEKEAFDAKIAEVSDKFKKQEDTIKMMFEIVEKIADSPATSSSVVKKDGVKEKKIKGLFSADQIAEYRKKAGLYN